MLPNRKEFAMSAVHRTKRCILIRDFVQNIIRDVLRIERINEVSVVWFLRLHI